MLAHLPFFESALSGRFSRRLVTNEAHGTLSGATRPRGSRFRRAGGAPYERYDADSGFLPLEPPDGAWAPTIVRAGEQWTCSRDAAELGFGAARSDADSGVRVSHRQLFAGARVAGSRRLRAPRWQVDCSRWCSMEEYAASARPFFSGRHHGPLSTPRGSSTDWSQTAPRWHRWTLGRDPGEPEEDS